ncbi:hypothetical protein R75465_07974 [Paraburkholderia aspalathi]|uniref:hypothetical protein n=1 Tax=Paraburkholderia aspalathi TaxID=1324617 RepID=UPI001B2A6943|nr:hypothetical protein [Paraburkholderia aspalathi]CAE6866195.1 hypothetical protein R75465_07974 [Paraburkholderia aspalathi]
MTRATYQESIRRSTILPTFTQSLAEVHFHPHADFATLNVFTCERLNSVLTKEACAANYTRSNAPLSCKGCPIGSAHADGLNYRDESDRHAKAEAAHGLSCIRCERNEHTATKYIARFRLTRKHTLCLNCFNREREVVRGYNAKGAKPVKHSGLKTVAITVKTAEGKRKVEDIGLRSGYPECARYVERLMPGATLLKTEFDGETIGQFSLWTPPPFSQWEPGMITCEKPKKPTRTYIRHVSVRSSKPSSAIASPVDWDNWDTPLYAKPASDDHSDADGNGNARRNGWLPPMSEEDDAAYRASFDEPALDPESIAAHWDLTADGLPEFIEWLTDGWPVFDIKPVEPSAPVADTSAAAEIAEPVSDAVCPVADAVSNPDPIADEHTESEWEGCSLTRGDETIYVTDYARERGISDEEAAIVLGMCDPEYTDEPEAAAAPEQEPTPEPVKAEPSPTPKKLTGKALRKQQKREAREAHAAAQTAKHMPATKAKAGAIAARALAIFDGMQKAGA